MYRKFVQDEVLDNGIIKGHMESIRTNADRIRSMTNEELAKYLDGVKRSTYNCTMPCNGETCVKCWLDWLKEEVKD